MNVDFLVGHARSEKYGTDKIATNIIPLMKGLGVKGKVIDYRLRYHFPLSRLLFVPAYYSFISHVKKRSDSIKHVTSQEHAHILNFTRLRPCVVTCHDVIPIAFKDVSRLELQYAYLYLRGLVKADWIITDSFSSKRDIEQYLNYPEDKITVIYPGVDHEKYRPRNVDQSILSKYGIADDTRYILHVGAESPRKNVEGLIKAFYKLKKVVKGVKLVKAGGSHWQPARSRLLRLISDLNLSRDVIFTNYVSEEELIELYNGAELFVFPSFYEGFGLPVLEAMACGIPVMASNSSSLPEVVGEDGLVVDPYNIDALARAMYEVLTNEGLRYDIANAGLKRAKEFSWEKTAQETVKVYQELQIKL
jgi:glycosyltransferase involved in cell wall biosynthesis